MLCQELTSAVAICHPGMMDLVQRLGSSHDNGLAGIRDKVTAPRIRITTVRHEEVQICIFNCPRDLSGTMPYSMDSSCLKSKLALARTSEYCHLLPGASEPSSQLSTFQTGTSTRSAAIQP